MAEIGSRKEFGSLKRIFGQMAALIAMLLLVFLLWLRNQPERLIESVGGKISGENVYWASYRNPNHQSDPGIQTRSIHGGAVQTLVQDDPNHEFYALYNFTIAEGKLTYAVQARTPRLDGVGGAGVGDGIGALGQSLGFFLLPPNRPAHPAVAGQKRVVLHQLPLSTKDVTFRQVSVKGGNPQDRATLRGEGFCLVGSHVFWIRARPEESVWVTQGWTAQDMTSWTEETANSDLMLTSLTDGTTRCIRAGVPRFTALISGASGVVFRLPAPFPGNPTFFYARVSDGSVHSLGITAQSTSVTSFLEAGGRLYWTVSLRETVPIYTRHEALMSATLDGTDRREILSEMGKLWLVRLSLYANQGSLYCVFEQLTADYRGRSKPFLCRLHPERSEPLEILRKLPAWAGSYQFDGGYLYFVLREVKRDFWATLTQDDEGASFTYTLCRLSLAE